MITGQIYPENICFFFLLFQLKILSLSLSLSASRKIYRISALQLEYNRRLLRRDETELEIIGPSRENSLTNRSRMTRVSNALRCLSSSSSSCQSPRSHKSRATASLSPFVVSLKLIRENFSRGRLLFLFRDITRAGEKSSEGKKIGQKGVDGNV